MCLYAAGAPDQTVLMTDALLVIDVQESFRVRESWNEVSNPDVAEDAGLLVDAARAAGQAVIWVLHAEPGSDTPFDPASGHVRLIDGLAPRDGEPVLTKTSRNAFTTTNLQQRLTTLGVRRVIICGIQTEQCCETTARLAADLGYDVDFVTDATATFPIRHRDPADPRVLATADIIERTEYALAGRFATIRTVKELTAA